MGHFIDRVYQLFICTIYNILVYATIAGTLFMIVNVLNKVIFFEDTVVSKISINHNTIIQAQNSTQICILLNMV